MSIYPDEFLPTYLYIKQHSVTKKLYFGKTCESYEEMLKYMGSGLHWKRHIKKHGKEYVETIWFCLFTEKEELVKFALMCSKQWEIVSSENWANLMEENGLDGSAKGRSLSEEAKKKHKGKAPAKDPVTGERLGKISSDDPRWQSGEIVHTSTGTHYTEDGLLKRKGWTHTEEACAKISKSHSGEGNSQFGTTYMINHTTKEKTRLPKLRVNDLIKLGWVVGNKHAYSFVNSKLLLSHLASS